MIDENLLSDEAKIVWSALGSRKQKIIQADYPIKTERNKVICDFRAAKVDVNILSEVSGLSRQSISVITNREARPDKATLTSLKSELKKIQRAVGRFGAYIDRLEKLQDG